MNTGWTILGSELYSIKTVRSVDVFEKSADQGPIYKGQMFKDKPILKRAVGSYAFAERLECKKLRKLIQYPDRVMLVSDRHNGIFNAIEAIFPYAAHGIFAYYLAQNLKRFCKQMDDVIWLYYRATYA
ncbi:hypothetical protein Dsin_008920 [Dipteronia sinensis]|uniref:Uncharacterized protein n=1 Tax=Dipteronia sinensis TaxID=43782 RepID=A0AAE0AQH7_9ROSI|nr:hypothetical protein Dsin_008920 [Dipteronia sinensis]